MVWNNFWTHCDVIMYRFRRNTLFSEMPCIWFLYFCFLGFCNSVFLQGFLPTTFATIASHPSIEEKSNLDIFFQFSHSGASKTYKISLKVLIGAFRKEAPTETRGLARLKIFKSSTSIVYLEFQRCPEWICSKYPTLLHPNCHGQNH